ALRARGHLRCHCRRQPGRSTRRHVAAPEQRPPAPGPAQPSTHEQASMMNHDIPVCAAPDPNPRPPRRPLPAGSCDSHAHLFGPAARYPPAPGGTHRPPAAAPGSDLTLLRTGASQRAVLVQPRVYGTDNSRLVDALAQDAPAGTDWRGVAVLDSRTSDAELERLHAL